MVFGRSAQAAGLKRSLAGIHDNYSKEHKEHLHKQICLTTIKWGSISLFIFALIAFLAIWVLIPISFMLSLSFQTFMVFIPINSPGNPNFDRPEDYGMEGVFNFYITTEDYHDNHTLTSIGAWLILPETDIGLNKSTNITEILQTTKYDVMIYLHGVLANRAKAIDQYKVFRKHFLVIAVDHRGYGDSGKNVRMSEAGITHDHLQIYDWVANATRLNPNQVDIYYWGHSMGTGISTSTLKLLKERKIVPKGLVLESAFTSLKDAVENIVFGRIFKWLAYFDSTILNPLDKNGFHFRSRDNILNIDCPVMFLHAEDDPVVPYFLGKRLAKEANDRRQSYQGSVTFHGIPAKFGFGHNEIVHHPNIHGFIEDFKKVCQQFRPAK